MQSDLMALPVHEHGCVSQKAPSQRYAYTKKSYAFKQRIIFVYNTCDFKYLLHFIFAIIHKAVHNPGTTSGQTE